MNITEEIKRIKYLRMKPEERFLYDILSKVDIEYNDYNNLIIYLIDNKIMFEYDFFIKCFFVDYYKIWKILCDNYNLKRTEIKNLIKNTITVKFGNELQIDNIEPSYFNVELNINY